MKAMNRRDILKYGGRWIILSGMGVLSAFLIYDQKIVTPEKCSVAPQCRNCSKFGQCELPQANKVKSDGK
jgi:hypothetical protein